MPKHQSLSHHDAVALRATFLLKPAPEFEAGWRAWGWPTTPGG